MKLDFVSYRCPYHPAYVYLEVSLVQIRDGEVRRGPAGPQAAGLLGPVEVAAARHGPAGEQRASVAGAEAGLAFVAETILNKSQSKSKTTLFK